MTLVKEVFCREKMYTEIDREKVNEFTSVYIQISDDSEL